MIILEFWIVCVSYFVLFVSLLSVFCRTLADIPSGNWGGCLSETILNDFFCMPEAIFKGFSLHPNTVIESDGRIPRTSRPAGRQFARQFKKMAKRSGRTGWKLQTDKIRSEGNYSSWQESIGLSWGETLSIICTYEIFLIFRLYPISTFADSPIIPSLKQSSPLISLLTLSLTLSHVAKCSPCCR